LGCFVVGVDGRDTNIWAGFGGIISLFLRRYGWVSWQITALMLDSGSEDGLAFCGYLESFMVNVCCVFIWSWLPGCPMKLTLKVFQSMKAAKRCRLFPSVCIQTSTMLLLVPRVNIVAVGNPPDARPG